MPLIQQGHAGFHLCLTQKLLEVGQMQQDLRADRRRANVEAIKLNRELTQLLDDLDLKVQIEDLSWLDLIQFNE
jgi:hypothetical protein